METVDLSNCDREPIHIPGSVQPHGCLIVCDEGAVTIRRQSVNAQAFLGLGEAGLVGRRLEEVLGAAPVHEMRNALLRSGTPARAGLLPRLRIPSAETEFDVSVHRFKGNAIIEFERSAPEGPSSPLEFIRTLVGRAQTTQSPEELILQSSRLLRSVLTYDRVMIYRFAPDGSGQVVSEAKRGDLESFMGQHFPASDIPQQARQLYLMNPIRVVSDASGDRHPIEPVLDEEGAPLDLSHAHLRSVSPIHCEYLRNMGVAASMSVSIIQDGALWGLIACHHYSKRALPMNQRIAAEIYGEVFALQLATLNQKQSLKAAADARRFLEGLLTSASHTTDVAEFLSGHLAAFRQLIACDGVGLWVDGVWSHDGAVPPADLAASLAARAAEGGPGQIWLTDALSEAMPASGSALAGIAGVIAIPLSQREPDYLFLFRRELVQTLNWGGDPNKSYTTGPNGDRLTPRQSFAVWKQTVEGRSQPWTETERELAESTRSVLVEVLLRHSEVLSEERKRSDARQLVLNQELNHRVKNILSIIRSVVSYPLRDDGDLPGYVTTLQGRIDALAFAHDQAIKPTGEGLLRDLLVAELGPYRSAAEGVRLSGPPVALDPRAFAVMALVVHELATNAVKYGALSVESGRLELSWQRDEADQCHLLWRETGGPPVRPPEREGFGSVLVSRSIPFDLGGRSDILFEPDGVVAKLVIPAAFLTWLAADPDRPEPPAATGPESADSVLAGRHVLVLEDQFLIAMDVEDMLLEFGAARVTVCSSQWEAHSALDRETPDLAVLDVNLGDETSSEIAARLEGLGVPFAFATGYDDGPAHVATRREHPVLRKPYKVPELRDVLARLWQEAGAAGGDGAG